MTTTSTPTADLVESLGAGSIYVMPQWVDWSEVPRVEDDDEAGYAWWEAHSKYEAADGTLFTVIVSDGVPVAAYTEAEAFIDLTLDYDDYATATDEPIDQEIFDELVDVDTSNWNVAGPRMNYFYAVEGLDEDQTVSAACTIRDLPLCVVRLGESYGLALTGGGQDMSWEICAAYVALGQLPPRHYCDLSSMAGSGQSQRDRVIIAACRRTYQVVMSQASFRLKLLTERFSAETPSI